MKKIFRLLLLGLFNIFLLPPSIVNAAEIQNDTFNTYTKLEEIAPRAAPRVEEVTLENGESYDFVSKVVLYDRYNLSKIFKSSFQIFCKPVLDKAYVKNETFRVERITNIPDGILGPLNLEDQSDSYIWSGSYDNVYETSYDNNLESTGIYDYGFRVTNYSAGPTTYCFTLNYIYAQSGAWIFPEDPPPTWDDSEVEWPNYDEQIYTSTPDTTEVTLQNGESYDFIKETACSLRPNLKYTFKVRPVSGDDETFLVESLSSKSGSLTKFAPDNFEFSNNFTLSEKDTSPGKNLHDFGFRITNYSAGPVTYKLGINYTQCPASAFYDRLIITDFDF